MMPQKTDRDYRAMAIPLAPLTVTATAARRIDSDHYVEGYATTFDTPYLLFEDDGIKYYEVIDRHALDGADMSDVIFQYDHRGTVFARNKMAQGKPQSLIIEPQQTGLFVAADLGLIDEARSLYNSIDKGLVYKMSWGFRAKESRYERGPMSCTRIVTQMQKVYDVSAVGLPANGDTEIAVRSCFNGAIEAWKRETLARQAQILLLQIKTEV